MCVFYVYVCVDVVRSPNPGLPPTPGNSVAVVMLLLSLLWLFLSLALLFWLCSSGFARSVAPVAAGAPLSLALRSMNDTPMHMHAVFDPRLTPFAYVCRTLSSPSATPAPLMPLRLGLWGGRPGSYWHSSLLLSKL